MIDEITLKQVCNSFKTFQAYDKREYLSNKEYTVFCDVIFCDGTYDHRLNSEGDIIISNVKNANYIAYLDHENRSRLDVYKYVPNHMYKDIMELADKLDAEANKTNPNNIGQSYESNQIAMVSPSDKLIDINEPICPVCGEPIKLTVISAAEVIMGLCEECMVEYSLVPSKYYVIKTKKQFYSSDNERKLIIPKQKQQIIQKKETSKNGQSNSKSAVSSRGNKKT